MFFTPKYLKHAKLLLKGVTRFLDYKRDLLPAKKLEEIEGLRVDLVNAIKERAQARIDTLTEEINRTCERSLPETRQSAIAENVEVFFVSIVIAMGIRTYIAQPFQIPTGSMQPTLNGIIAERHREDMQAGFMDKALGWLTGTSYLNALSDHEGDVIAGSSVTEHQFLIFRPYCQLHFVDGHTISIGCPKRQLEDELQLWQNIGANTGRGEAAGPDMTQMVQVHYGQRIHIKEGQLLARGVVHNGDHVIVNKFAYHFRNPTRGEVFVFTTKNIAGIRLDPPQQGSQHYIKRLAGVPGDTLDVRSPELYINGEPAKEPGFRRVIDNAVLPAKRGAYAYQGYSPDSQIPLPITLANGPNREYFAMGDNSYNSSDSRYWGTVPAQNLVGCGSFCYWPLTNHWGPIR